MKNNNISEFNQDDAEWRRASYIIAAVIIYCGCKLMTGLDFFLCSLKCLNVQLSYHSFLWHQVGI